MARRVGGGELGKKDPPAGRDVTRFIYYCFVISEGAGRCFGENSQPFPPPPAAGKREFRTFQGVCERGKRENFSKNPAKDLREPRGLKLFISFPFFQIYSVIRAPVYVFSPGCGRIYELIENSEELAIFHALTSATSCLLAVHVHKTRKFTLFLLISHII